MINPFEVAPIYAEEKFVSLHRPKDDGCITYQIDQETGRVLSFFFIQQSTPFALLFEEIQQTTSTTGRIPVLLQTPMRGLTFPEEVETDKLGTIGCEKRKGVWWGLFPPVHINNTVVTPKLTVVLPKSGWQANPNKYLSERTPRLPALIAGISARMQNTQAIHY